MLDWSQSCAFGRAKKGLWEGLERTSQQQVPPLWDEAEERGAQGCSRLPSPALHAPLRASRCCRAAVFFQKHKARSAVPPGHSTLHPQGPSQAGARADQGLPARKSTILKEKERSVKV